MSEADQGFVCDVGKQSVGGYTVRWLEDIAKADPAPRTYHNYKLQIREHIIPAFSTMKLSKLGTPTYRPSTQPSSTMASSPRAYATYTPYCTAP